jgi:hypothetical protein
MASSVPARDRNQPAWLPYAYRAALVLLVPLAITYALEADFYFRHMHGIMDSYGRPLGRDFINWWTAAKAALDGDVMTLFDFDTFHDLQQTLLKESLEFRNWSYPPHIIPWIMWLGLMPYTMAFAVWTALTFIAYAFAVAYKRAKPWIVTLFLMLAPSTCINAIEGHTGFLTAALLVGGLRLLDEAPIAAGVLFGFLSVKPHFGLMLPIALVAGRYWRTIGATLVTTLLLVAASIYLFGMEPWQAFLDITMPAQRDLLEADIGQLYQIMMISPFMTMRLSGYSLMTAYSVTGVVALVAALAVIYVFRYSRSNELRGAVTITTTFLASPYMFNYDTPAMSAVVVAMIMLALDENRRLRPYHLALFLVVWLLPYGVMTLGWIDLPLYPIAPLALLALQMIWATPPSYLLKASRTPA